MAVKLRLVRMGKKKQPTYRVVAADSRSPRDGRFLEIVGTYAPRGASTAEPDAVIKIDNEKAVKWLVNGAQPTERVEKLLRMPPQRAGEIIVKGVARGKARILVGMDAKVASLIERVMPVSYWRLLGRRLP